MKSFKIYTLGCKVNTYESEAISEILLNAGYSLSNEENADIIIVNTCAVTSVAGQKSRKQIHKVRRENPNSLIIALGCFVQLEKDKLFLEGADILLGTNNRKEIVELIENYYIEKENKILLNNPRENNVYECLSICTYSENTRAFVKIQDGCDNFCSYCIIPYTRGKFRSRSKKDVLNEIHNLVSNGFKEIVLTGIDTASYGKDINENFVSLLEEILASEPNLLRLRISSIEASQIDERFIDLLHKEKRIAMHLHIPLQSGSEEVLKRMNRKYTKAEFYSRIEKIKEEHKDIALACDIIEGFPGETEEEFEETIEFVKKCGFVFLHVFPYSIRVGTPAAKMKNQIDSKTKKERVKKLINIGLELEKEYKEKFVDKELEVLFETNEGDVWKGYSSNYLEVKVASKVNLKNKMVLVKYKSEGHSEIINIK